MAMAVSSCDDAICPRFLDGYSKEILPWDRFNRWITCFCVVTFDLELGQAMELIYPRFVKLTEKEKMSICYLAFPDSNSGCMGDTKFHFRIRSETYTCKKNSCCRSNENGLPLGYKSDPGHYYGFVYFRQVKDPSIPRGYFQKTLSVVVEFHFNTGMARSYRIFLSRNKSLVLISRLPYVNFFSAVLKIVAPGFFQMHEPALEASCHDIDQWPFPNAGKTLQLPIMGCVLQLHLPSRKDKPGAVLSPDNDVKKSIVPPIPAPMVIPMLKEADTYRCLFPVLNHIHLVWELVLLNEPLVVMAPTPSLCSDVVQSLIASILPLHYNSDFRPFFTIHDSEFKEYTTKTHAPPPIVIGVTNPFFAKTLQHWPHILRIGKMNNLVISSRPSSPGHSNKKPFEAKPGIYTRYKPFLHKDKPFIKKLTRGGQRKRPPEAQHAMLRRHMTELTQSFMIPLERYAASLMPLQRSISPWKLPPKLKSFDAEEFLKTVEHSGPQLTTGLKGNWTGLYRNFFKSPNFEGWFRYRQSEIQQKLQLLHLEALSCADILSWISGKEEIEIVDLILQTREKMHLATSFETQVTDEVQKKLRSQMERVMDTLPEDLQSILRQS